MAVENIEGVIKRECPLSFVCLLALLFTLAISHSIWEKPSFQGADLFLFAPYLSEMIVIQVTNVLSHGDSRSPPSPKPGSEENTGQRALVTCSLCK